MEQNRWNWKTITFIFLCCFLAYKFLPTKKYRQVTGREVDSWKNKLKEVSFRGEVNSINIPDNKSRIARTIYLKILDTADVIIPDSCEYFKLKEGMLLLTAHNLNISTGPDHAIKPGDILTKLKNTDSICVYTNEGCCKFCFPLFDGLGSEDSVRMPMTASSPCQ